MILNLNRLWQILSPGERRRFFMVLGMVMLMAGLETAGVVSIMPFLAVLGNPDMATEHAALQWAFQYFGFNSVQDFILALGLFSGTIVVISALFKSVTQHALNRFANLQRHYISSRLLATYLRQPYTFFLGRNSADLTTSMLSEVDQLVANLLQPVIQMIAHGVVILAMVGLLLVYDSKMAVIVAAVVATLYGLIYLVVHGILGRIGSDRSKANEERFLACGEALGGIKEVKVSGTADAYLSRFRDPSRRFSRHLATNETLSQVPLYLVEALGYTGLITLTLVLALRGDNLGQVLPVLGLYGFAAYRMLPAAQIVYRGFARMRFGASALEHIHADLHLDHPEATREVRADPQSVVALKDAIEVRDVYFAYPGQPDIPALKGITLTIRANTTVGIVGQTGSGKSTLIDLLLGLLPPQKGVITVDGMALTPERIPAWQRSIGYVPQHIYLADSSVAENIAFGVARDAIDMDAVVRAARAAQLHDFVAGDLPEGYQTEVGERGVRLSGGQRQRIGIARALYHDPDLLILDEATSALDNLTERAVMEAVHHLGTRKTIILIAHRLTTVRDCDRIVLLEQGRLDGQGKFNDLAQQSTRFRAMAERFAGAN